MSNMAKLFIFSLISSLLLSACSSTSAPTPPKKKNLSVQPHNRPASWEGTGGLGAMMGPQYQD